MPDIKWVSSAGTNTRYVEAPGQGATIVFLHAGGFADHGVCHNLRVWEHNIGGFAGVARTLAFDALGHGRNERPADREGFAYQNLVDHAGAFVAATCDGPVHLVGHDEGGLIALRLAFQAPELVRSVTITGGTAVAPAGDPLSNLTIDAALEPRYSRIGQAWVMGRQSYTGHHIDTGGFLEEAVSIAEGESSASLRRELHEDGLYDAIVRPSRARFRVDNWVRFREEGVPVPILLIWGQNDPMSSVHNAVALFRLVAPRQSIAHLRFIGRAGYMPFREQPDAFNGIVSGFVRALEGDDAL